MDKVLNQVKNKGIGVINSIEAPILNDVYG